MNRSLYLMNDQSTTIQKKINCKTLSITLFFIIYSFDFCMSQELGTPAIPFSPETYVAYRAENPFQIDGNIQKKEWQHAPWTNAFGDIRGGEYPAPRFETRAKMLWDDNYFYFAAQLEEQHVWATITERDAVIYMDNNFEIFIDPTGDTHHYLELEVNALGTFWDLMLTRPYRNGGRAIDAWDIKGLKVGIGIQGTLNNPSDTDSSWTVEIAIPWEVLTEVKRGVHPSDGDQWRVNFSRVQWNTEIVNGQYVKIKNPNTGEDLPEDNWTWSPQGLINMHYPEMWGYVQFSDAIASTRNVDFEWNDAENYKWLLRKLYYRQVDYWSKNGHYAEEAGLLNFNELFEELFDDNHPKPHITISVLDNTYIMRFSGDHMGHNFYIRNDSKIWKTER